MGDVIARLSVVLGMETAAFQEGATLAEKQINNTAKKIEKFGERMSGLGQKLAIGLSAPLAAIGVKAVQGFVDQERAVADVEAALRSMGGASGKTAEELNKTADALEMRSLFDADVILKQVTANLLTFGNVAGREFDRAQQAAVDMATRLGGEPQAAAIMLGKALNDPVKGIAALTKVGVQFTAGQKEQITAMTAAGNAAGAQGVILAEVERQFAGAAQAAADATPWRKAQVAIGQAMDAIGAAILPLIGPITDAIVSVTHAFAALPEPVQQAAVVAGILAAALGPVLIVIGSVTSAIAPMLAGLSAVITAALSTGAAAGGLTVALTGLRAMVISLVVSMGPYALALAGVAAALYLIFGRSNEAAKASASYRDQQEKLKSIQERTRDATQKLATATGAARAEAIANAKALKQETLQYLANARAALIAAKAKSQEVAARAEAERQRTRRIDAMSRDEFGGTGIAIENPKTAADRAQADADLKVAKSNEAKAEAELARLNKIINAPAPKIEAPVVADPKSHGTGAGMTGTAKPSGPSAKEIEARFNDELINYTQQSLSSMQQVATSAAERAELQLRSLEWTRRQTLEGIAADEDYSAAQKEELRLAVERLADHERSAIEFQRQVEAEKELTDVARDEFDIRRDQLSAQADLADTQDERKRLALQILDLEQEYRRNQLEMVAASQTASDAEKERARRILASLDAQDALDRQRVERSNETDAERWFREANKTPEQMAEARTGIGLDGLDGLIDGLSQIPGKVTSINDAFKAMRSVFQGVIQDMIAQLIRLQLQKAIAGLVGNILGGLGGGGANYGSILSGVDFNVGGITGAFAKGTNFAPGGLALVGERGPELVNLPRGSQVVPNNELRGMRGGDSYHINVAVGGRMSERERRETGAQIASAAQRKLATTRRNGTA